MHGAYVVMFKIEGRVCGAYSQMRYFLFQSDFSKTPLQNEEEVDKWLRYFTFPGPMVFGSVVVSEDPVRLQPENCA